MSALPEPGTNLSNKTDILFSVSPPINSLIKFSLTLPLDKSFVLSCSIFDLIRKIVNAKNGGDEVVLWGDGTQTRELIFIELESKDINYENLISIKMLIERLHTLNLWFNLF